MLQACLASSALIEDGSYARQNEERLEFADLAVPLFPVKEFLYDVPDCQRQSCYHPRCALMDRAAPPWRECFQEGASAA